MAKQTTEERFWKFVTMGKPTECWPWGGSILGGARGGYGQFYLDGKIKKAHRVAYELMVGAIPEGMVIDHKCFTRACCNPFHMSVTTPEDNSSRQQRKPAKTSRFSGVIWDRFSDDWVARITIADKQVVLGRYKVEEEAGAAYQAVLLELQALVSRDLAAQGGVQ